MRLSSQKISYLNFFNTVINSLLSSKFNCSSFWKPDGRRSWSLRRRCNTATSTTFSLRMLTRLKFEWLTFQVKVTLLQQTLLVKSRRTIKRPSSASYARSVSTRHCWRLMRTSRRLSIATKSLNRDALKDKMPAKTSWSRSNRGNSKKTWSTSRSL